MYTLQIHINVQWQHSTFQRLLFMARPMYLIIDSSIITFSPRVHPNFSCIPNTSIIGLIFWRTSHVASLCLTRLVLSTKWMKCQIWWWQLSNQNEANKRTTSLQCKGQKRDGLREIELELENKGKMCRETAPVGLQEGAGRLSFTMVCIPKGMHSRPRVRDDYMAAVF